MPDYLHICEWCKQQFFSKRPHSIFCTGKCRVQSCRTKKDFVLIDEMVPEKEVKGSFYAKQAEASIIYLHWYRKETEKSDYDRFADVYMAKEYSRQLQLKMERKKIPISVRRYNI